MGRPNLEFSEVKVKPDPFTEFISSLFGIIYFLLSFIVLPLLSVSLILMPVDLLRDSRVAKYIGTYYSHLKMDDKVCISYNFLFTIRRILISLYATQLYLYPAI